MRLRLTLNTSWKHGAMAAGETITGAIWLDKYKSPLTCTAVPKKKRARELPQRTEQIQYGVLLNTGRVDNAFDGGLRSVKHAKFATEHGYKPGAALRPQQRRIVTIYEDWTDVHEGGN